MPGVGLLAVGPGRRVRRVPVWPDPAKPPTDADFRAHARFRHALRRFLRFSEDAARGAGLTSAQHQLLLAVRGSSRGWLSVGEVARTMRVRPHSAAGLVERAAHAGLVDKVADPQDQRRVRVCLSERGARLIAELTVAHRAELRRLWSRVPSLR